MANKQDLKVSEARIIIYLSQVDNQHRYIGAISAKLDIDYSYTIHLLAGMVAKKWLRFESTAIKSHYFLTQQAPTERAKKLLAVGE